MFRKVSFNIFEENLQSIVFGDKSERISDSALGQKDEQQDKPIPKPRAEFWRQPYIARYLPKHRHEFLSEVS